MEIDEILRIAENGVVEFELTESNLASLKSHNERTEECTIKLALDGKFCREGQIYCRVFIHPRVNHLMRADVLAALNSGPATTRQLAARFGAHRTDLALRSLYRNGEIELITAKESFGEHQWCKK